MASADVPIGAHSMLQLNAPYSFMQTMFAEAAGMHASMIRLDVAPALVFTDPSQAPDFSGLDEVLALSRQYDLPVLGDLFTVPWWIADCQTPTDIAQMSRCGTDNLALYGSMIAQIVARADPVIHDWEVWNEPDNGEFFTGTPPQYAHMLRAAHDAIKQIDPEADVLLGGISSTAGMSWLAQVFAVPDADAAHAFDIANIHERGQLGALSGDIASWKHFFAGYGFTGPLWVTEHGYPSDAAFQYDPSYAGGVASQAAYLSASIPTLIDAGASFVFVTGRDNLDGQFASEGVLGGDVSDPPVADPQVIEKPAYAAVRSIADCYASFARDCPGAPPTSLPSSVAIPSTPVGSSAVSTLSVADPGTSPLQLGALTLLGAGSSPLAVQSDSCSDLILEPGQTCLVSVQFTPAVAGSVTAALRLPSDNGMLTVPLTAVATSVASLSSPELASPRFTPTASADGVGHTQRLVLEFTNPLSGTVDVAQSTLSGADAGRFLIQSDTCTGTDLGPEATCRLSLVFTPIEPGAAVAQLTLRGDGSPLVVTLRATAFALPAVIRLAATGRSACFAPGSRDGVLVVTSEPAALGWEVRREAHRARPRCHGVIPIARAGERTSATGHTTTTGALGTGSARRLALPLVSGREGLRPGVYRLTVTVVNAHGAGRPRTMVFTVLP